MGELSVEDQVRAVAEAWAAALVGNDASRIAGFMTDEWVYVDATGAVAKADVLAWIASGRLVHRTMTVVGTDRVVRAGDAVVYTARTSSSGVWDGVSYTADEWITEVFAPVDGRWRCVFSQKTDVAH
jgi:ketosteroid isomerase-like protein